MFKTRSNEGNRKDWTKRQMRMKEILLKTSSTGSKETREGHTFLKKEKIML